ncbi:MAG: glycosyltransferase [Myxococcota bacterium]
MRIALIHEWISDLGGSEKVLKEILSLFPDYHLFTLFFRKESLYRLGIDESRVTASFLNKIRGISKIYRSLLPIFPTAIESLNISDYDVIFSSSHIAAKGVIPKPYQIHICYCHTPARYLWDMSNEYLKMRGLDRAPFSIISHTALNYLRLWDVSTSNRVDYFIANSEYTKRRIKKYYNRDAVVIHPPVEIERFYSSPKGDYFLFLSRLVPYKRCDLAVKVFSEIKDRLIVIGDGPEKKRLMKMATKNVKFTGYLDDEEVRRYLSGARALIYPSEEDFGITMVEALASGTPVIAFARGGASEIVRDIRGSDFPTGILFEEQSVSSIIEAIEIFKKNEGLFKTDVLIDASKRFAKQIFDEKILQFMKNIR